MKIIVKQHLTYNANWEKELWRNELKWLLQIE
jgi:hypothetical protein